MRLYLAGNITGRSTKEVREERLAAAALVREYGWTPVDPIAGEYTALKGRRSIQDDQAKLTSTSIARKDRFAIEHSDMLVWLTGGTPSYGSCIEVGLAWGTGVPVLVVDPTGVGRKSAFVRHIAAYIGDTLEDVLAFIRDYMVVDDVLPEVADE